MARIDVSYRSLPVHEQFHRSRARERHMFGAFGSGKTYAVCAEAIAWCLEQPGIRGLITRKTIPELRDTTETVFFDVLPDEIYKAGKTERAGGHYSSFTFPNGSKVLFRGIDDWTKHKSLNVGFIAWDEMDEFDEETYDGMMSRLRQVDPTAEGRRAGAGSIRKRGTWGASNPAGHNWIWKRWVDKPRPGTEHFKSTSFDNPYLTPDYYERLLQYPLPWIRRYVLCQFDDFGGQIYEGWAWETHVVPRYPLEAGEPRYPAHSMHWMGMDPGSRDPTAGLWVVVERQPRARIVGVAEYQEAGLSAKKHAAAWRAVEARRRLRVTRRIADPNRINVRDTGSNNQLSDIYRRLGFNFELGPSRFDDRIPALGTLIENGQFVVTEDCPHTFESIRDAKWKDLTPKQKETGEEPKAEPLKRDRHLCDAAEYLAGRWVRPVPIAAGPPDDGRPDWMREAQAAITRKLAAAKHRQPRMLEGVGT